jgi:hypothetical protein
MKKCKTQAMATAVHEAGHCVIATLDFIPIKYVTLRPRPKEDDEYRKFKKRDRSRGWKQRLENHGGLTSLNTKHLDAHECLAIDVAGAIAEKLYRGRKMWWGDSKDMEHAIEATKLIVELNDTKAAMLLAKHGLMREPISEEKKQQRQQQEQKRLLSHAQVDAKRYLTKFWPQTMALAETLLERKTLTGKEVKTILGDISKWR